MSIEQKTNVPALQSAVTTQSQPVNRFHTVAEWPKHHSWPSVAGLRHLIFNAQKFGFDKCIRRAGRRILISEQDFFAWLASNRGDINGQVQE